MKREEGRVPGGRSPLGLRSTSRWLLPAGLGRATSTPDLLYAGFSFWSCQHVVSGLLVTPRRLGESPAAP